MFLKELFEKISREDGVLLPEIQHASDFVLGEQQPEFSVRKISRRCYLIVCRTFLQVLQSVENILGESRAVNIFLDTVLMPRLSNH